MTRTLASVAVALALSCGATSVLAGATVTQSGDDNYATIEQVTAAATDATVYQLGNGNRAGSAADGESAAIVGIYQSSTVGSNASIWQRGNDNDATIRQVDATYSSARVVQGESALSHGNRAVIDQNAIASSGAEVFQDAATGNYGAVRQSGSGNWGQVVQGAWIWSGTGWGYVGTPAVGNYGEVVQDGSQLAARSSQVGSYNSSFTWQGGNWNESAIIQDGSSNGASVSQFGTGANFAERNVATIRQTGAGHSASVSQSGKMNFAGIVQH